MNGEHFSEFSLWTMFSYSFVRDFTQHYVQGPDCWMTDGKIGGCTIRHCTMEVECKMNNVYEYIELPREKDTTHSNPSI